MTTVTDGTQRWEIATDPEEVHELLCASDRHQGARFGSPVPQRNPATTARRVSDRTVHLLRGPDRAAAMFTLTLEPAFAVPAGVFLPARRPVYLSRLAVRPELMAAGSLAGAVCVRRANVVAAELRADQLRAEANPDLDSTVVLLQTFGFARCGGTFGGGDEPRRVYLHRRLG